MCEQLGVSDAFGSVFVPKSYSSRTVAGGIPLKRPREVYQYTPPSPPNGHPFSLLTTFNSDDWQR